MNKEWITPAGETVPAKFVPSIDKKKTATVLRLVKQATAAQEKLRVLKSKLFAECDDIYQLMQDNAKVRTGKKGNYTISTFSKDAKIEVSIQESLSFDDNITFAKEKIEAYVADKAKGVDEDLLKLVHLAFESRKGQLDSKRVLGLFKLKIKHPLWQEAMELIKTSIDRNFSKRYARIWLRQEDGSYQAIELNFSKL